MRKVILGVVVVILVGIMAFGGVKIYQGLNSYEVIEEYYDTAEQYVVEEPPIPPAPPVSEIVAEISVEETELVLEMSTIEPEEPLERAPISIDFTTLLADAPDAVGWLYAPDKTVNLPVVQGSDNQYYLTHLPDGGYSSGGSLFLDYLNAGDFTDEVSFIYGHNMKNGTMLQPILEYQKQSYYDANPVMYLLTPEQDYKLELFAGILTGIESDVYTFNFDSLESKQAFIDGLVARSTFVPARVPQAEERILCLSTCAYDYENARYVVFAALTKLG